jgi:FkbM family methyltransferase
MKVIDNTNSSEPPAVEQTIEDVDKKQPPFGAYAPTFMQGILIGLARHTPLGRGRSRWLISKMIEWIRPGPVDVLSFGLKQRIHHYGAHFVEKKMLLHLHDYDKREFAWLQAALRPDFRFVDIGANVGIYVLRVKSWDLSARIVAVEANPKYAERLRFNVAANNLENVAVVNAALAATEGTALYYLKDESMIGSGPSIPVPTMTLNNLLHAQGFARVDAMKIDIEGFEDRVLAPFFETAPRSMWPRLLIMEAWTKAIVDLCVECGYQVRRAEPGMNTILELSNE